MVEKLRIIFTIPELRQKILLTLGLLAIYRVGWQVPLPIVDPKAMSAFAEESGGIGDLLCTVMVETPVSLTRKQKDLLREFGDSLAGSDEKHTPEATSWLDKAKKFIEDHLKP